MNAVRLFVLISLVLPSFVSAASIVPGDLIISEVMANPDAVSDAAGEWFELHNLTGNSLNLDGLTLSDNGSNLHVIDSGGSLIIDPFGYLVFGRSGDESGNGGYTADYVYSGFTLSNIEDEIIISNTGVEIVRLEYTSGFAVAGKSQELSGNVGLALDNSNYVSSIGSFGAGDYGTPGLEGDASWKLDVQPVPVPAAFWLFGSGLVWLFGLKKKGLRFTQAILTSYRVVY